MRCALSTSEDLDVLIEAIGDKKYVLLGEATHGTSEFYKLRMELSRKLIETKGFSFIAVEGDWPSCYEVNRYVKQYKDAKPKLRSRSWKLLIAGRRGCGRMKRLGN